MNVPLERILKVRLTAIQRVGFFEARVSFSGQPDRRAKTQRNPRTLARLSGFPLPKPNTRAKSTGNPTILARVSGFN